MKVILTVCGLLMTFTISLCKFSKDNTTMVYKKNKPSHYLDNYSQSGYKGNNSLLHHKGNNSLLQHKDSNYQQHYKGNNSLLHYFGNYSAVNRTSGKQTALNFRDSLLFRRWYPGSYGRRNTKDSHENIQEGESISRFSTPGSLDASATSNSVGNKWKTDSISNSTDTHTLYNENGQYHVLSEDNKESETGNQTGEDFRSTTAVSTEDAITDKTESIRNTEMGDTEEAILEINGESEASSFGLESNPFEDESSELVREWNTPFEDESSELDRDWNKPPIDYFKCGRCVCNASENGSSLQANCANHNLGKFPGNLSPNTTYLNLQGNHIKLEFNKLSKYTVLLILDISFNNIEEVNNNTCNESSPLHTVDLSHNKILTIDDNSFNCLPRLTHLYLQNNNLKILTSSMLAGNSRLRYLDLSYNLLKIISPSTFSSTPNLRVLKVGNNHYLHYGKKIINSKLFKPLKQLEVLHIQGFKKECEKYPTDALLELTNLQELNIDGVVSGKFEPKLTALKNVTILKIGVDGHCIVHNLTTDYFRGLPYLRFIHMSGCKPKSISASAFETNTLLEDLRHTRTYYEFDSLFESLSGLKHSSIKSLTINYVTKGNGRTACRSLGAIHAKNIKNMPHLKELNLENNLISLIEYGFLSNLPVTLEKLNLRKNTLHFLRTVITNNGTSFLKNLVEVKEEMQNRDVLNYNNEDQDDSSETVTCSRHIQANAVFQPTAPVPYSSSSTNIAAKNSSSSLGYGLPPNLEFYSAAHSFHFGIVLLSRSTQKNKVRFFNISNTYLTDWGNKLLPPQVEVADFSDNYCDYLKPSFFRPNNSLKELHIAGNFLGDIFAKDEMGDLLSRLHRVRFADLSRNHIQYLPPLFFTGLLRVKVLDLSKNNIRNFNVSLSHMSSLRFINLNQNSISWISRQTRNDLDLLNMHKQVSIDLTSNRLLCTCDGIEVLQWLATTNVRILKKDFLECETENNQVTTIGDLNERLSYLILSCPHLP